MAYDQSIAAIGTSAPLPSNTRARPRGSRGRAAARQDVAGAGCRAARSRWDSTRDRSSRSGIAASGGTACRPSRACSKPARRRAGSRPGIPRRSRPRRWLARSCSSQRARSRFARIWSMRARRARSARQRRLADAAVGVEPVALLERAHGRHRPRRRSDRERSSEPRARSPLPPGARAAPARAHRSTPGSSVGPDGTAGPAAAAPRCSRYAASSALQAVVQDGARLLALDARVDARPSRSASCRWRAGRGRRLAGEVPVRVEARSDRPCRRSGDSRDESRRRSA